jgi:hypothetical protein
MLPTLMLTVALAAGAEPKVEQVQVDVRLLYGDPLGSRAEGTLKHISEPKLVTQNDRPAFFRAGGRKFVT